MKALRLFTMISLGLTLLSAPHASLAQQAAKVYRIGVLSSTGPEQENFIWGDLRRLLSERGLVEGQNLTLEWRYAEGKYDRLPDLAAELVQLKPDLIMARGGPGTTAAKRATATIPIVMYNVTDPVGIGVVQSLARPGGNVTGLSDDQDPAIVGKRLQLLKEVAPKVSKVASLTRVPPPGLTYSRYDAAQEAGAKALGLQVRPWYVQGPDDIEKAFTAISQEGFGALEVVYVPVTWNNRRQIADLAVSKRLPTIYWNRTYAVDGGLMAYGEDEREVPRRLAVFVDKILRGAKPVDLPIEQPTKFELVINLKIAKAMGLTIPQSLLRRADEVLQ